MQEQLSKGGVKTQYAYGPAGNISRVIRPDGTEFLLTAGQSRNLVNILSGQSTEDFPLNPVRPEDTNATVEQIGPDTEPPQITRTIPANGTTITVPPGQEQTTITVAGTVSALEGDLENVSVNQVNAVFLSASTSGERDVTFSIPWLLSGTTGPYTLAVAATDANGLATEETVVVNVVESDTPNQPPAFNNLTVAVDPAAEIINGTPHRWLEISGTVTDPESNLAFISMDGVALTVDLPAEDGETLVDEILKTPYGSFPTDPSIDQPAFVTALDGQGLQTELIAADIAIKDQSQLAQFSTIFPLPNSTLSLANFSTPHTVAVMCEIEALDPALLENDFTQVLLNEEPVDCNIGQTVICSGSLELVLDTESKTRAALPFWMTI